MSSNVQPYDFAMRVEDHAGATVVVLEGELDIAEAPAVINDLRDLVATQKGVIILDVRRLTYIDSAGLAVIASTRAALAQEGRSMLAVGCHGVFEKVLHLTQLDKDIECIASMETALERASDPRESS